MDGHWNTVHKGDDAADVPLQGDRIWLRVAADIHPGAGRTAVFSYSTDGRTFASIGEPFVLNNRWQFFMGYRFGLFNYATRSLGGAVTVPSFTMTSPSLGEVFVLEVISVVEMKDFPKRVCSLLDVQSLKRSSLHLFHLGLLDTSCFLIK